MRRVIAWPKQKGWAEQEEPSKDMGRLKAGFVSPKRVVCKDNVFWGQEFNEEACKRA